MPIIYPTIENSDLQQQVTSTFGGMNHNYKVGDGECWDCENVSADYYPLMATRKARKTILTSAAHQGIVAMGDDLYVVHNKQLCMPVQGGYNVISEDTPITSEGNVTLVGFGAYIVVWPDKVMYNTASGTWSNLENTVIKDTEDADRNPWVPFVSFFASPDDGVTNYTFDDVAPEKPADGDYWYDCTDRLKNVLKRWNESASQWVTVETDCVKIWGTGIGAGFKVGDAVTINTETTRLFDCRDIIQHGNMLTNEALKDAVLALNGSHIIKACGTDYIVISGTIDAYAYLTYETFSTVTISRTAPDLDYLTVYNNRIWGCRYSTAGDGINEIYACKLGDPSNWNVFAGISTDSYTTSVGEPGPWTGAITYDGHPMFFKENRFYKVYVSGTGAHQIVDSQMTGIMNGSAKSAVVCDSKLYYLSNDGFVCYTGSTPSIVSDKLGKGKLTDGVAGYKGHKVFLSCKMDGYRRLYVYDADRGFWTRENYIIANDFETANGRLFCDGTDSTEKRKLMEIDTDEDKGDIEWMASSGRIGLDYMERKYISRLNLKLKLAEMATCKVEIMYDFDGNWKDKGTIVGRGDRTFMLPVRPKRCDSCCIRLSGKGDMKLYAISKIFEKGSDFE